MWKNFYYTAGGDRCLSIKQQILDFVISEQRAIMPKEISKSLNIKDKEKFKKCIKGLKKEAKIVENNKGKLHQGMK